jgi:SPP1 gp7 family putative phage head morphogenesis protein
MAEVLKHNVFVFSGFKTYKQLQEASLLMLNPSTGALRSFNEFMKDALAINETYNIAYLQAEYNHAVAAAQSMAEWERVWEAREAVPYLKYKTAEDERVRENHRPLNDVVRLVDDKFWDMYYPPNGWNCRCVVVPVVSAKAEELEQVPALPDVPPMFRTNVGKTGVIFPNTHPYYKTANEQAIIKKSESLIADNRVDIKILRGASKRAAESYIGQSKSFPQIVKAVEITKSGIAHMASYGSNETYRYKLEALKRIDLLLQRAVYKSSEPDYKGRRNVSIHKLETSYGEHKIELIVREAEQKAILYDLKIKKEGP